MEKRYVTVKMILLICAIILIATVGVVATDDDEEKIIIRVGYNAGHGIINDIDSIDYIGFGFEILKRVEHYSNFTFEFVEYEGLDVFRGLRENEIDIMGVMLENEVLGEMFEYVPKVLGSTQLILATREAEIYYDNPQAIDGKTVASFYDNPYEEHLDNYCKQHGISINYIRDSLDDYVELEADYYLVTTIDQNVDGLRMVLNLEVFDMYFVAQKGQTELANQLAQAIEDAVCVDGTLLEELQIKYFGRKELNRRYLTQEEISLLSNQTFVCGYIDHHQPIQYTDENGEADGISVEVLNMLAENYNFDVEYVAYNHDMPHVSHENFDMLISATGVFDHEMEYYAPTAPFIELPMMLFADQKHIEQIISEEFDSKIGMVKYITIDQSDIIERYPSNTVVLFDTFDELFNAFVAGEVDGLLATANGVEYAQAEFDEEHYVISSTGVYLPLRLFISKESEHLTEYLGAFNILFEHIDQERIDEILSKQTVLYLPEYTTADFVLDNAAILILIILIIAMVVIGIILYLQYKRKKAIMNIINNDNVTKLISLYNFTEQAKAILKHANPSDYEIISLDIDSFHTINLYYSKEKGNEVINRVANTLVNAYKDTDALVSRVIADHFIVLHKIKEGHSIKDICESNIAHAIRETVGEKYNLSLSVGSCVVVDSDNTIDEIIDFAVAARLKGKDKYEFTYNEYDENLKNELELKTSIVYRMKEALVNGEFKVVFQPKINFDTLVIGGAEALVRWHNPLKETVVSPADFIGIFESNGFIVNLDMYVFEEVCKFIVENENVFDIPLISVNVSSVTLFDERFPSQYLDILQKYGVKPEKLEIEVTESAMTLDQKVLMEKTKAVRSSGMHLSIDDFGAGESSLNRLSSIIADTIKLDKAFLDYNIAEERGGIVVDNVIKMAKQLDMKVVSEGVETIEQAIWLKSLNCDLAQGYFFEKPMSIYEFKKLLEAKKKYSLKE